MASTIATRGPREAADQFLASTRATPGYRALAYDVLMLVEVLKEDWTSVHDRTPVTLTELDRAAVTAKKLLSAVGLRDQAAPTVTEATVIRRRAFALFLQVYAKARAVVQYLRADSGDADEIAPSLYAGRVKRRKAGGETPDGTTASSEPGNDQSAISRPSLQSGDDGMPALERRTAADAVDRGGSRFVSAAGNDIHSGFAQRLGMLLTGRGPPADRRSPLSTGSVQPHGTLL